MEKAEIQALIREAFAAQKFAYVPYSHFHVGAALRGKNGQVFRHFVHNASTIVASIAASFLYMFSQGNAAAGSGYATETYIGMYLIEAALMPIGLYMGSRLLTYQQTKSEGFFPKERRKKTIAKIVIPTILLILGGLFFLGIGMM